MPMPEMLLVLAISLLAEPGIVEPSASDETFKLEQIDFTQNCSPNDVFRRLVNVMIGDNDDFGDFQSPAGNIQHRLSLDEPVDWHGLRLSAVHLSFGIEREPTLYSLIFANDAEEVRAVWNKRGWRLPPVGNSRNIRDPLDPVEASVGASRSDDNNIRVTCSHD